MSFVRRSLVSGSVEALSAFLSESNNVALFSGRWGEIINCVFVNRERSEVEQFSRFVVELVKSKLIPGQQHFVDLTLSFLALNCDDSVGDCPLFCRYLGALLGALCAEKLVPQSAVHSLHSVYFGQLNEAENEMLTVDLKTKIRRFSQIVLALLDSMQKHCDSVAVQGVAQHVDRGHIDRAVFKKEENAALHRLLFAD